MYGCYYENYNSLCQGYNVNYSSLCGERVTEERQRLGLSQADAGALCGVSREMWGKYERGKAVMGTEVLSRFALNGADALYILTGQRNAATPALKPDEAALLDNYRHAPKEQQDILKATSAAFAQCCKGSDKEVG